MEKTSTTNVPRISLSTQHMTEKTPRIAVVYDHLLTRYGGAELVLQALLHAFPDAQLHTVIHNPKMTPWVLPNKVTSLFSARWAPWFTIRELLDPCLPFLVETIDVSKYDIIISVTSSYAKGVITRPDQLHISYILNTIRYLYEAQGSLAKQHPWFKIWGIKTIAVLVQRYLRSWDLQASQRPDVVLTLSDLVRRRITDTYQRNVTALLTPPIPTHQMAFQSNQTDQKNRSYVLCISRLVEYKQIDILLAACLKLKQKIIIAGAGRAEKMLQNAAKESIYVRKPEQTLEHCLAAAEATGALCIFWGACSEVEKAELHAVARVFCMPGIEDFGITAVEALTYGVPVVISKQSGAAELLRDGIHGVYIQSQDVDGIATALKKALTKKFVTAQLTKTVAAYSETAFVRKIHNIVSQFYKKHVTIGV